MNKELKDMNTEEFLDYIGRLCKSWYENSSKLKILYKSKVKEDIQDGL